LVKRERWVLLNLNSIYWALVDKIWAELIESVEYIFFEFLEELIKIEKIEFLLELYLLKDIMTKLFNHWWNN
jgi:hypothetical protein